MKQVSLAIVLVLSIGCSDSVDPDPCEERISFNVVCPGPLPANATDTLIVNDYTAENINQLSIGSTGNGVIDPPELQVPDPADASTTIPEPPYEFTFTALTVGDAELTITTFDLGTPGCSTSQICEFDILPPE